MELHLIYTHIYVMKYFLLLLFFFTSCISEVSQSQELRNNIIRKNSREDATFFNTTGNTIATRIHTPAGYTRIACENGSYTHFLRNIVLKPSEALVTYYNGAVKQNNNVYCAVLQFDTGTKDLQQCADAVMRIRAEYLYSQKRYDEIIFNFTNGFKACYTRWKNGERILVKGNTCSWIKSTYEDASHATFREYLDMVYNYAGSMSLSKQLKKVEKFNDILPGDILIIGGTPGHAETVMDVAVNAAGKKIFLLSQGYMPAQDIQVLKNNTNEDADNPWYYVEDITNTIYTPEYTFTKDCLKRF